MKAQFVFENIDFQRGKDPKSTLGIGLIETIESLIDEYAEENGFRKYEKDRNHGYLEWSRSMPENNITLRWNLEDRIPILDIEHFNLKMMKLSGKEVLPFIESGRMAEWFAKEVYESVNFERGKDPKGAMGLGLVGAVRHEANRLGLTKESTIDLVSQSEYGNKVGTSYHWDDETWANHIELDVYNNYFNFPALRVYNSEDFEYEITGTEEIMEHVANGSLASFINLE